MLNLSDTLLLYLAYWAGTFYLLNKIFFLFAEINSTRERKWKLVSWSVYIIGLPAWVLIFINQQNYIAASIETGGAPSMIMGFIIASRGDDKDPPLILDIIAVCAIILGVYISYKDLGSLSLPTQRLEIIMVIGFLFGTYLLAKKKTAGYYFFLMMNASNAYLMHLTENPGLVKQQIASFIIVLCAVMIKHIKQWKRNFDNS